MIGVLSPRTYALMKIVEFKLYGDLIREMAKKKPFYGKVYRDYLQHSGTFDGLKKRNEKRNGTSSNDPRL